MAETLTIEEMNARLAGRSAGPEVLTFEQMNARLGGPGDADVLSLEEMSQRTTGGGDAPEVLTLEQMNQRLSVPAILPVVPRRAPRFPGPTTTGGARRQLLEDMGVPIAPTATTPRPRRSREENLEVAKSAAKAVPRGAIEAAATGLSPFVLGARLNRQQIDRLTPLIQGAAGLDETGLADLARTIQRSLNLSSTQQVILIHTVRDVARGALAPEAVPERLAQVKFTGVERAQTAMREFAAETFPIPPEHEKTLPVQVGRGIGSTGVFLGARLLTGVPGLVVTAASLGSGEAIENAIAAGASDAEQAKAALLGIGPGLTDILPIERLLKPIKRIPGMEGGLLAIARKAVEQGAIEGTQEAVQAFLQNAVSMVTHTPETELAEGIRENGVVGFLVGMIFGTAAGTVQVIRQTPAELRPAEAVASDPGVPGGQPAAPPTPPVAPAAEDIPPAPPAPAEPTAPPAPDNWPADVPRRTYRGFGRTDRGTVYRGPDVPILGAGRYAAFSEEGAREFGPEVEARDTALRNPLVIRSDEEWRALTKEAGWRFPNPFGQSSEEIERQTESLQRLVRDRGHDGVVVFWDDATTTDTDSRGNSVKLLRNTFGKPQVVEFGEGPTAQPAVPQAPVEGESTVVTPRGRRIETRFEVVDADSIVTSHGPDLQVNPAFPAELQPRERTRAASADQVRNIAANLTPELLGQSVSASEGAPIVGPDGVVESGNARTLAIRSAYERNLPSGQRYRDWLASQGHDTTGIENPILIRRRSTELSPEDRVAFVREANERTTLDQSASERAQTDAANITASLLDAYQGGDITALGNRNFVRGFVDTLAPSERAAVLTANGEISQEGAQRIRNALFAKAYGEPEIIAALREDRDTKFKAIGEAMMDAAPAWAQMRAAAVKGDMPAALDATGALIEALTIVRRARRKGVSVGVFIQQTDAFEQTSPEAHEFLRLMFQDDALSRPASRQRVANALQVYAEEAQRHSAQPGLVPDETTVQDVLAAVRRQIEGGLLDVLPPAAESVLPEFAGMAPPGENFVGFVPDRVEGVTARDPLRREAILRPLLAALDIRLFQGRMKGRKLLGFYRRNIEEVRIKNMNDIETAAHELAHMLDDRFPEIRQQWLPASKANAAIRAELSGVSYDRTKLFEGFAEFMRLWATQKEEAQARAPKMSEWFEGWLDRSEHGPALRRAQADMHAWFAQDALSRARSKIGTAEDINAGLTTLRSRFRQSVADDLEGIYEMERELTGGIAPMGAYEKARTSRAAHSMAEGVLLYGTLRVNADGSHSFVGKGLREILGPVADRIDDFILYAVGQSSNELMQQGRERLFTKAEIRAMLDLETPEFKTAFESYQEWNRGIVDFAQAKGLISPAFRAAWRRTQYLPYHRVGQPGAFSAVSGEWKGIKALTGGTDNLRDILQNIINNSTSLIQAALINEARLDVAKLASERGGARYMAKIPSEEKAVKVHREEIRRAILEAFGVRSVNELPPDIAVTIDQMIDGLEPMTSLIMRGQPPLGRNIVTVLRGGRPEYYEVIDPILYRAMMALKRKPRNRVLNFLSIMRRFRQSAITLTTDFVSKNLFRDTLMATVMSRHGFVPLVDSFRGLVARARRDPDYKDFVANGGGMASYLLDEDSYRAHMEAFYAKKGFRKGSVLHTAKEFAFFIGRIADAVEMSARLGEFKRARAKGKPLRHAAFSAREVSTDFAMRGDSEALQYLYDGAMFAKVAVNGIDRYYRGLVHDPNRKRVAALTGLFVVAVIANHVRNLDDDDIAEEYKDLPDWERDFYLHFYVPTDAMLQHRAGFGEKPPEGEQFHHFRVPTIWEVGGIAASATRGYDGFVEKQPIEAAGHIARIAKDQFSSSILPAAVEPLIESYFNHRFFTGRPIEHRGIQDLPPYMRATAGTTRTIRKLGEAQKGFPRGLQLSPAKIEALLDGYLNSWGTYGLTLADQLIYDDAPDMRFEDIPGFGVFYRPSPPGSTKSQKQFYEFLREANEARNAIHDLAFRWRTEEATAGTREFWAQQQAFLSSQQQAISGLRKLRDRVLFAPDLESVQTVVVESMARTTLFGSDVGRLYQGGNWNDLGALKKQISNLITVKRNQILRNAVRAVEERKRGRK